MKKIMLLAGGLASVAAVCAGRALWAQQPAQVQAPAQTRVGFVNLARMFQDYEKARYIKSEIEKVIEPKRLEREKLAKEIISWKNDLQNPKFPAENRPRWERGIVNNTRAIEDLEKEMRKIISEKNEQQYVQLYKDIHDAVARFSAANNYQIVLAYVEPTNGDPFSIMNIMRKVQGMDMGGCITALYVAPGLDVSAEILATLNHAYRAGGGPVVPATPVSLPKQ